MKRRYEESHKWLTFELDLRRTSPETWMMLGECQSKCEHIAKYPLRPDVSKNIHQIYKVKGVLATTAIEGNTLSEEEVKRILEGDHSLPPSREYLGQEVSNIIEECNRILKAITEGKPLPLSAQRIIDINQVVLNRLKLEAHNIPGQIRTYDVGVGGYKGAPHEDCPYLLEKMCQWLNNTTYWGDRGNSRAIVYAIIKAVLAHLYLAWIHPFGDGNGRTARLIEFQILICSGVPSPAAHLLSNHYYRTRTEYYRQLNNASSYGGDVMPFIEYAVQGFLDGLKEQLEVVKQQVMDVVWMNYVADQFLDKTRPSDIRRRDLIDDLSRMSEPTSIAFDNIPLLSNRISQHYNKRTKKTLARDIKELYDMKLITFDKGMIRARKEQVLAFLPSKIDLLG